MHSRYWYLATPYTRYPGGAEAAFTLASENTAILMKAGVPVFSPIAHTHPVHMTGLTADFSHDDWIAADMPMMEAAYGLLFLRADGWEASRGMFAEHGFFTREGKPIVDMWPGEVPAELLLHANYRKQLQAAFGHWPDYPEMLRYFDAFTRSWNDPVNAFRATIKAFT